MLNCFFDYSSSSRCFFASANSSSVISSFSYAILSAFSFLVNSSIELSTDAACFCGFGALFVAVAFAAALLARSSGLMAIVCF